jgi:NADPH:quinone reductase-like Zn-dependent oxidoreductase
MSEMPDMMHAVRFHTHGGPEVLRYELAPVPQLGPHDALVRVRACALNHLDIWTRVGARGWKIPLPHILGNDVAGEVAAVGSRVLHLQPGLECFVHPGLPGGPTAERLRGDDNVAADYNIVGLFSDGGYAQYVRVPADNVLPKPARLSWEEAAAFPLTFLTAWHMLGRRRSGLRSGETVLVVGANSGVGTAAIQVAKARGARVIATAGGEDKAAFAKGLGADEVVDHYARAGEIHKAVYELTDGQGVDVAVDHVGAAVFMQCVKALRRGGRLVTCGTTTGGQFEVDVQMLYAKHLTLYGSFMGSMGETLELLPLVERGVLKPIVDRAFPLEQAAEAHRYMESSAQCGKIVLLPE